MKIRIEIEGDLYEDREEINTFLHAQDIKSLLWEIRERIRARLKYGEDITDKEEEALEEIRELTYFTMD